MTAHHDRTEYMTVFLSDMEEHLQMLESALLSLEKIGPDPDLVQTIFRAAHSLKGSSAVMGFESMTQLTHRMEDVLDKIRSQVLYVTREVIDILFQCLDLLNLMRQSLSSGGTLEQVDTILLVGSLDNILKGEPARRTLEEAAAAKPDIPALLAARSIWNEDALAAKEKEGSRVYWIHAQLRDDVDLKLARFFVILSKLNELGVVVSTCPDLYEAEEDPAELHVWFVSDAAQEAIEQHAFNEADLSKVHFAQRTSAKALAALAAPSARSAEREGGGHSVQPEKRNKTVRIDIERLELLMNTLSELVIYQTRNVQVSGELSALFREEAVVKELVNNTATMSKVISELQEHVIKTRMQPVEQLYNRLPRMVRDLSLTLEKEVELELVGGDTELDRTVLEEIGDPLIHILRNSIDHGIEDPETRSLRQKPAKGTITVRAAQQENLVTLTISDDGGGIDPERIKKSALDKQLITQQEADHMSGEQAIQLIFAPGFSTAQKVTDISGRGVGMDIVRSHIEKINGIIEIRSEVGKGTDFHIRLPLTMAIIRGILFQLAGRVLALPMSAVLEIVNVRSAQLEEAAGYEVFRYRGHLLPIKWVHDDLGLQRPNVGSAEFKLIVVGISDKRFAMPVDALIGFQDIVVKPISEKVEKKEIISNATILGNGQVALILDAAGIYRSLSQARRASMRHVEA